MEILCSFCDPLYRYEPDDYIRHLELSVVRHTEMGEPILLG
jgi:hypothetical protein